MTIERDICDHLAQVSYEDLPADAVKAAKRSILDTLGVMLAATTAEPDAMEIASYAREAGGREESTVVGFGDALPSHLAALVNGALCHPLDFDDTHEEAPCHPTAETFPAALAAAERRGDVNGRELLTAVAVATDLTCRIGMAVDIGPPQHGWLPAAVYGYFGGASAAAKALRLTAEQTLNALGIAFCQTAGSHEMAKGSGSFRGIRDAFSQQTGVQSALLAERGITGPDRFLEGEAGLYRQYFKGRYTRSKLVDGLGKSFEGVNVSHKPWPACRLFHPYIDALLQVLEDEKLQSGDVAEVVPYVSTWTKMLSEPRAPASAMDGKFNLPFTLGVALAHGEVRIKHYLDAGLRDKASLAASGKVRHVLDTSLSDGMITPGRIIVRLRDGREVEKTVEHSYGSRENPITDADLEQKFLDCIKHAAQPMSEDEARCLIDSVWAMDGIENVAEWARTHFRSSRTGRRRGGEVGRLRSSSGRALTEVESAAAKAGEQ